MSPGDFPEASPTPLRVFHVVLEAALDGLVEERGEVVAVGAEGLAGERATGDQDGELLALAITVDLDHRDRALDGDALEHGFDQGPAVRALLEAAGFTDVASTRDLGGHERVTAGRKP